MMFANYSKPS